MHTLSFYNNCYFVRTIPTDCAIFGLRPVRAMNLLVLAKSSRFKSVEFAIDGSSENAPRAISLRNVLIKIYQLINGERN